MASVARFAFAVVLAELAASASKGSHVFEGVASADARRNSGRTTGRHAGGWSESRRRSGGEVDAPRRPSGGRKRCGGGKRARRQKGIAGHSSGILMNVIRSGDASKRRFVGGEEGAAIPGPIFASQSKVVEDATNLRFAAKTEGGKPMFVFAVVMTRLLERQRSVELGFPGDENFRSSKDAIRGGEGIIRENVGWRSDGGRVRIRWRRRSDGRRETEGRDALDFRPVLLGEGVGRQGRRGSSDGFGISGMDPVEEGGREAVLHTMEQCKFRWIPRPGRF